MEILALIELNCLKIAFNSCFSSSSASTQIPWGGSSKTSFHSSQKLFMNLFHNTVSCLRSMFLSWSCAALCWSWGISCHFGKCHYWQTMNTTAWGQGSANIKGEDTAGVPLFHGDWKINSVLSDLISCAALGYYGPHPLHGIQWSGPLVMQAC